MIMIVSIGTKKEAAAIYFKIPSQNFVGGTEETH